MKGVRMTDRKTKWGYVTGDESLTLGNSKVGDKKISDFFKYASGDLMHNTVRGKFAEWMVAQLLCIDPGHGTMWRAFDLWYKKQCRIEVKCAAFWQRWSHEPCSKIVFTGLRSIKHDEEKDEPASVIRDGRKVAVRGYCSHLYIFCLHQHMKHEGWNACDLNQWRFYILRCTDFAEKPRKSSSTDWSLTKDDEGPESLSLSQVQKKWLNLKELLDLSDFGDELTANDLKKAIDTIRKKDPNLCKQ